MTDATTDASTTVSSTAHEDSETDSQSRSQPQEAQPTTTPPGAESRRTDDGSTPGEPGIRAVARFEPAIAGTILFAVFGLATGEPVLFFAAALPVAFIVYSSLSAAPTPPANLEYTRSIDDTRVFPGTETDVTLTIRNPTDTAIPSLDVVDGVPDDIVVTDGSPRASVALGPHSDTTIQYTISATRGAYTFDAPNVQTANLANTVTNRSFPTVTGDDTVTCTVALDALDLPTKTTSYVGPVPTDSGGPGIEFYATREYHTSDPAKRINWREYAKTGDLTTVQYREQNAARVIVLVDARPVARVSAHPGLPTGTALAGYAGAVLVRALSDAGHSVGAALLGTTEPGPHDTPPALIDPNSVNATERAINACEHAAGLTPPSNAPETASQQHRPAAGSDDDSRAVQRFRERLPPDAQVLLITPAVDDLPSRLADELAPYGHPLTVVSPDITDPGRADPTVDLADPFERGQTLAQQVRSTERAAELSAVQRRGIAVIDWGPDTTLAVALNEALQTVTSTA